MAAPALLARIPLVRRLQTATREDLRADVVAGLTTAVMLVPQAMAYAMLAGLEPIVGLYASTLPLALYALFGSSRPLAVGPVAMDSLMVAAGLLPLVAMGGATTPAEYASAAALLALMVGAIQVVLGVLRAGVLVRFLAQPVILGFTAAAAVVIGLSQLGAALGVSLPRSQQVHVILLAATERLAEVHASTLALTIVSLVTLALLKKWAPAFPRFLLVVAVGTALVWAFGLADAGVAIVGEVPAGLPSFGLPTIDLALVGPLFPTAFAIALVAMLEALSVAKRYDSDVVPNQELVSLGLANLGSGMVAGYPVTGGFSRTAVNAEAGARTPLAGLITAGLVVLTLLFLTDGFTYLPKAVLASIILSAVAGLVDMQGLRGLWHSSRLDFGVAAVTFVATLSVGIQLGMATGVVTSLLVFLARTATPRVWDASRTADVLELRVGGPLYFGNVEVVQQTVRTLEQTKNRATGVRRVVVDVQAVDSVAERFVTELTERYGREGIPVERRDASRPAA